MTEQIVADAATKAVKLAETAVKKAWSLMEAAAEKQTPTEYLSPNAVQAIQGVAKPGDK